MSATTRAEAKRRLEAYLANPEHRTIEERAPQLRLKNGVWLMIERRVWGECEYVVSLDYGCTCREVARVKTIDELLDVVLVHGKAKEA